MIRFLSLACLIFPILMKVKGEVEEEIVVQELITQVRRNMRNLSTVGGLRQMVNFPISVIHVPLSVLKHIKMGRNVAR